MQPERTASKTLAALLAIIASSAMAAQWEIVIPADETSPAEIAIDMESLSIDNGRVGIWARANFSEAQSLKLNKVSTEGGFSPQFRIVLYRSSLTFSRYRCEARQKQTVEYLLYAGPSLSGDQAFSSKMQAVVEPAWRNFDVEEIRPGTPAEILLFAVCEAALDRGLLKGPLPWTASGRSVVNGSRSGANHIATAALLLPAALVSFLLTHFIFRAISKRTFANSTVLMMLLATWILAIVIWITSAAVIADLLGAPHDGVVMFVIALASSIVIKIVAHYWRIGPN